MGTTKDTMTTSTVYLKVERVDARTCELARAVSVADLHESLGGVAGRLAMMMPTMRPLITGLRVAADHQPRVVEICFRHNHQGNALPQTAKMRLDDRQKALRVMPRFLIQPHANLVRRVGFLLQQGRDVEPERGPAAQVSAEFLAVQPDFRFGGCGLKLQQDAFGRGHGEAWQVFAVPSFAVPVDAFVRLKTGGDADSLPLISRGAVALEKPVAIERNLLPAGTGLRRQQHRPDQREK